VEEAGCRWVHRGGSYELLRALLERGEVCYITWDTPGKQNVPVRLLGRTWHVAGNVARLALQTGARVVPGFSMREGNAPISVLFPGIDPSEVGGESEVNGRMAAAVESALGPRLAQANKGIAHNHDWRPPGERLVPLWASASSEGCEDY
jgi:lauroyl/myristoyl acyltransferase